MTAVTVMTRPLDWQREAACRGVDRDLFFPGEYEVPSPFAKALCDRCPVREACLAHALKHEEVGIWGGLTDEEREKISINRSRVKCPDCRSYNVIDMGNHEVCANCGLSWPV